jgi:anti-anti-sigma regulatory factor
MMSGDVPHAFDVTLTGSSVIDGRILTIIIRKEFDAAGLTQGWATDIIRAHPGPVEEVIIDMSQIGLVSSTFFAGIMQLQAHYSTHGAGRLLLRRPDRRAERNLRVMRLDQFFTIESR